MAKLINILDDRTADAIRLGAPRSKKLKGATKAKRERKSVYTVGYYADGDNLYLKLGESGTKSWSFRYRLDGKSHSLGLGPYPLVSLAEARERATKYRRLLIDDIDPLEKKRADRQKRLVAAAVPTFRECAEGWLSANKGKWRDHKAVPTFKQRMRDYVYPIVGDEKVSAIDNPLVLRVLNQRLKDKKGKVTDDIMWTTKPKMAGEIRGQLERILGWAKTLGYRTGDNPAQWRGNLEDALPGVGELRKSKGIKAHDMLPADHMAEYMTALRQVDTLPAKALEFVILTAARLGEVLGATWQEIDQAARLWAIPGGRMKEGEDHTVPLSDAAVALLEALPRSSNLVFARVKETALRDLAKGTRSDLPPRTTHGFRATFRTWAGDSGYPRELAEQALAHAVGNKVEQAYLRTNYLERRKPMMQSWADFCAGKVSAGNVTRLRAHDRFSAGRLAHLTT